MSERLQKLLAQAGFGSRRSCEELIIAGRVRVNGQVAILGQKADPKSDKIVLDGKPLPEREPLTYIALYKPRNIISSVEDEVGRKTVRDLIPETGHLYPVGRLDWDSEGLILMTNDGELTNRLTHPRYGHQKEYRVLVAKRPEPEQLATWRRGVVLEDGYKTAPANVYAEVGAGKGCWLRLSMGEGRKRQIREIGSLLGLPVVRIVRIALGSLRLGTLKPGDWRHLTESEVAELKGGRPATINKNDRKPGLKGNKPGDRGKSRTRDLLQHKRR
jgi:23S rRNA pseudouridine2605 synthase